MCGFYRLQSSITCITYSYFKSSARGRRVSSIQLTHDCQLIIVLRARRQLFPRRKRGRTKNCKIRCCERADAESCDEKMSNLEALAELDSEYVKLVREMRHSIVDHDGSIPLSDYEVLNIQRVENRELEARHNSMIELLRMEMSRTDAERAPVLQLYHGSPRALEIAMNGFKADFIGIHSLFGEGIYFSSLSSKSNQYAWGNNFGTCPEHRNRACIVCPRRMLVCRCYMGKPFVPRRTNQPVPAGFHSVIAEPKNVPGLRYPEFVVLNTAQALPRYLITYKIKP